MFITQASFHQSSLRSFAALPSSKYPPRPRRCFRIFNLTRRGKYTRNSSHPSVVICVNCQEIGCSQLHRGYPPPPFFARKLDIANTKQPTRTTLLNIRPVVGLPLITQGLSVQRRNQPQSFAQNTWFWVTVACCMHSSVVYMVREVGDDARHPPPTCH